MRRAVTFVVRGNKYELVWDPTVSVTEQLAWIKQTQQNGLACDCVEHWNSDGDRRRFHPPAPKAKNGKKALKI
jgi:hypothetical protein